MAVLFFFCFFFLSRWFTFKLCTNASACHNVASVVQIPNPMLEVNPTVPEPFHEGGEEEKMFCVFDLTFAFR